MLAIAKYGLGLDFASLRSLAFLAVVFGNQATTYTNRERLHLWSSRPSPWLVASSVADVLIATSLAILGIAMKALPVADVGIVLAAAGAFAVFLDFAKVPLLARLRIA